MILKSEGMKVVAIKKKTKAKLFQDVKEGDILQFEMRLSHAGQSSGGGVYATFITVRNLTQGISTSNSQSQLVNNLRNFELKE